MKFVKSMILIMSAVVLMTGCHHSNVEEAKALVTENQEVEVAVKDSVVETESLTLEFVQTSRHDDSRNVFSMTYDFVPQNTLAVTNAMIEMMLSLGLEEQMAGTSYAENNILPSLEEAYAQVPIMSPTYPSKEDILIHDVDFIIAWGGDFNDKGVGSIDWLNENNIRAYIPRSVEADATVNEIYEDFLNLGEIFNVLDRAEAVNAKIKNDLAAVEETLSSVENPIRVMGYDSAANGAVVIGTGINNEIIKMAQAENIFDDQDKSYPEVSWEEIVERNPEAIIVLEYSVETGGETYEEKVEFLRNHPALSDVDAVKNNRFIKLDLAELYPGERTPLTVKKLAEFFYPEQF